MNRGIVPHLKGKLGEDSKDVVARFINSKGRIKTHKGTKYANVSEAGKTSRADTVLDGEIIVALNDAAIGKETTLSKDTAARASRQIEQYLLWGGELPDGVIKKARELYNMLRDENGHVIARKNAAIEDGYGNSYILKSDRKTDKAAADKAAAEKAAAEKAAAAKQAAEKKAAAEKAAAKQAAEKKAAAEKAAAKQAAEKKAAAEKAAAKQAAEKKAAAERARQREQQQRQREQQQRQREQQQREREQQQRAQQQREREEQQRAQRAREEQQRAQRAREQFLSEQRARRATRLVHGFIVPNPYPGGRSRSSSGYSGYSGSGYGSISSSTGRARTNYVSGYTRSNGTQVSGYWRS